MYSRTRAFAPGSEEAGKGGERRGGERGKGLLLRQSGVPWTWDSLDSRGESSGEGPIGEGGAGEASEARCGVRGPT